MSEEKKSFTIKDRRHFTADGQPRDEAATEPVEATPAEPARDEPSGPAPAAEEPRAGGPPAVDFAGFLLSIAAQASFALTGEGGEGTPDLAAARHFIALFEMLRDKTEGRRTPQEDEILQRILYELRMAYLARAQSGGA